MKCNVGKTDRILRVIAGLVIITLGVIYQSWWGLLGVIPLTTATLGWCPAYIPFGFSSCSTKK
ncbi:MAG: DUF2892 domain-containing protein [Porticoccaceae bacterium]|jgi:hypothetical protein